MSLRDDFDRSFALPPPARDPDTVDILLVRVGDEPWALRLAEVAAVHVDLAIAAMPTDDAAFLGLVTVRNALVPVFDLAVLRGARGAASAGRWFVAPRGEIAMIFTVDGFDGHHRAHRADELVGGRPILDVAEVAREVARRTQGDPHAS